MEVKVRGVAGVALMQLQIFREFHSLPPIDPKDGMTLEDIRYFYNALRPSLMGKNWNPDGR